MKKLFRSIKNTAKKAVKAVCNKVVSVKAAVIGSAVSVYTALQVKSAHAAIDLTGVTVDTSDYITIATFLITALVAFWGIKKGLGLLGR